MKNGIGLVQLRLQIGRVWWLLLLFLWTAAVTVKAGDYTYATNSDNTITITGYTGSGGAVVIPSAIDGKTVTGIGDSAFQESTNLTSVTIPASIASIVGGAFSGCESLTTITVDAANTFFSSADGVLFNKSQTLLIQCPGAKTGSYTIPASVTNIGDRAFRLCISLTSVTIPASVASIGDQAFALCYYLASVFFEGNAPGIGSNVFFEYITIDATVYYRPGTTGWGTNFAGRPTVRWTVGPIIRANLSRDDITIHSGDNLSVLFQIIDSGQYQGIDVDWWVVALAGSDWYYLNSLMQWMPFDGNPANCRPVCQGALRNIPIITVLNMTVICGSFTFWFAVDYPMDRILNLDGQILIDSVNVNVQ